MQNDLRQIGTANRKFGTRAALYLYQLQNSKSKISNMRQQLGTPMSDNQKFNSVSKTKQDELPKDVLDLISAVESLPTEHQIALKPFVDRVADNTKRRRRILSLVQEALSQLRLDMKYLVFDLEATRRERDAYKDNLDNE